MFFRSAVIRKGSPRIACLSALTLFVVCSQAMQAQAKPESEGPFDTLILRNATIIDGTGAPAKGPIDIVIKNNIIEQLLPGDPIGRARTGSPSATAANAHIIDAKGMYVTPGLVDMHIHFQTTLPLDYQYKLLLGHGVTTIRFFNIGDYTPQQMVDEKHRSAANQIIAPRMYAYPFWRAYPNDPRFNSAKDAPQIVREWKKLGVDGVKMAGLPGEYPDIFKSVSDEAHKQDMGLAVHIAQEAVYPMNAVRVAEEGASTIEHHYGYSESSFTDRQIQKLPPEYNYSSEPERFYETGAVWLQADLEKLHTTVIDSLLATSQKTGFTMVPTMVVYKANRDIERAKSLPWLNDFALPDIMAHWSPSPSAHGSYFYHWTSDNEADWAQMYRRWQDFVEDYKNRGGKVAVGSDVGSIYSLWGFATIREIALLEECGFSPLEALHSATEVGAISLGNHQLGAIRPGYLADLVILTANPLEDIKVMYGTGATRQSEDGRSIQVKAVKYTIRNGVVFDSQALLQDVKDMVTKAKAEPSKKGN